ncbi:hydrogenase maturation protein [Streptomyces mashuensis]|uniref:Hydrogenase maturation protein n=1 Tax=Streptomyces mashuensis TaxID=33904 RepID=A0A919B921_9ACTN|nr:enoyl-CoA hydratase-related protein [Streptomyces mashuensis]GHF65149.1 hydrogenase maturation protein [Streptomyces mashuensis]
MRILLIAGAFNSLTQRVFAELGDHGHDVLVALAEGEEELCGAVRRHDPDLVVAPVLRAALPREVFSRHTCLVVLPGPPGERGPSALDRAVQEGLPVWGVTVVQAETEPDAGPVWASEEFALPAGVPKGDVYRGELADAAVTAVLRAVDRFASGGWSPRPWPGPGLRTRPYLPQSARRIDWEQQGTAEVLRRLHAADSQPGVRDELLGEEWFLYGGHGEDRLRGRPGRVLATRAGAICRATADGAVWIPQLRRRTSPDGLPAVKLPAVAALGELLPDVPDVPVPLELPAHRRTWSDIRYAEEGEVGFVRFRFPGGAMSTVQCRRLLAAWRFARSRPTSVIVLGGERDFFGTGLHLNVIEASPDPARESWANTGALADLVEAVLTTTDRCVVAALAGNAAAGGAMLALAADEVWCRSGAVLSPHYRTLGLYGAEFWTYTLPRRVGAEGAAALMAEAAPVSAARARELGLADRVVAVPPAEFAPAVARMAAELVESGEAQARIGEKRAAREREESGGPLAACREREMERMRQAFFSPEAPYHALRSAFVRKQPTAATAALLEQLSRVRTQRAPATRQEPCQI